MDINSLIHDGTSIKIWRLVNNVVSLSMYQLPHLFVSDYINMRVCEK